MADFPTINPQRNTRHYLKQIPCRPFTDNAMKRKIFKLLRNVSSGFISKKEVREHIFSRDGFKCRNCQSTEHLQVDHIISVWACFKGEISVEDLNSEKNLQTLCRSCNAAKIP